jgi:hypothetical protein
MLGVEPTLPVIGGRSAVLSGTSAADARMGN